MESGTATSSSHTRSSPFLLLPAEIRLKIYEHLMIDSRGDILLDSDNFVGKGRPIVRMNLSSQLLQTSHLIHSEAGAVLYGGNKFWSHKRNDIELFQKRIGQVNADTMRSAATFTQLVALREQLSTMSI